MADAREAGMREMSERFRKLGSQVYVDAGPVEERSPPKSRR
jgi:hypothetical protein